MTCNSTSVRSNTANPCNQEMVPFCLARINLFDLLSDCVFCCGEKESSPWPICKWFSETFFLDTERAPPVMGYEQQWLGFSHGSLAAKAKLKKSWYVCRQGNSSLLLAECLLYNSNHCGDGIEQPPEKSEGDASDLQEWYKIHTCIVNTPRSVGYPSCTTWVE